MNKKLYITNVVNDIHKYTVITSRNKLKMFLKKVGNHTNNFNIMQEARIK